MRTAHLYNGSGVDIMASLEPDSVDSVITDPPYGVEPFDQEWGCGIPDAAFWRAALRVAKPGAFLLAFGSDNKHHRLMCNIEDAGWQIRDCLMWIFTPRNPKSMDVGRSMDRANPVKEWLGWGTQIKTAWEAIVVAMKPMEGTFGANALAHGVAGLNIEGSRIPPAPGETQKRWPTNVLLDEEAGKLLNEQAGKRIAHFFYSIRANWERAESNHPNLKPQALMEHLCRLTATPTGGKVLDPCMGSGSTGVAALSVGRDFVGIELLEHYYELSGTRIKKHHPTAKVCCWGEGI